MKLPCASLTVPSHANSWGGCVRRIRRPRNDWSEGGGIVIAADHEEEGLDQFAENFSCLIFIHLHPICVILSHSAQWLLVILLVFMSGNFTFHLVIPVSVPTTVHVHMMVKECREFPLSCQWERALCRAWSVSRTEDFLLDIRCNVAKLLVSFQRRLLWCHSLSLCILVLWSS